MAKIIWQPDPERVGQSRIRHFSGWAEDRFGRPLTTYPDLWRFSVDEPEKFWQAIAEYFDVQFNAPYTNVLSSRSMPGAHWFEGAELNYARHVLSGDDSLLAIRAYSETGPRRDLTVGELKHEVSRVAQALRNAGVGAGDRVASYLPNLPETMIAFLATASLGAIWSSCAPEMGTRNVLDRFLQIEPVALFAGDGYEFGGRFFDRRPQVQDMVDALPSLSTVISIRHPSTIERTPATQVSGNVDVLHWERLEAGSSVEFVSVPFEHPLWIVYSSGTTGRPKPIVHGHGGVLLEYLKANGLQRDLGPGKGMFWFTTTGWVMWNIATSIPLVGGYSVLYDGSPVHPDPLQLWRIAEDSGVFMFGASPGYFDASTQDAKLLTALRSMRLDRLELVGSSGSPLPTPVQVRVQELLGDRALFASMSGGTDVATGLVGAVTVMPGYEAEIQTRMLGCKVESFDSDGKPQIGKVGELVVTQPLPTMPVCFWGDEGDERLLESYFRTFPGVWRHGDWIEITERGSCVIRGRSDSTLNRGGVRIGSAEFYSLLDGVDGIEDSLVVDVASQIVVFLKTNEDFRSSSDDLVRLCRVELSPRHSPDLIVQVEDIPRTINGKRLEVPIKRLLEGAALDDVVSLDNVANPDAIRDVQRAYNMKVGASHG